MRQPSVYSMDQILAASLTIIQKAGREKVTARAIAKELGSSTMPIYSRVKSVDELDPMLKQKARKILISYQQRAYTEDPLLNMAIGYIVFARDEKNVFKYLFLEKTEVMQEGRMQENMRDSFLEDFGAENQETGPLAAMTVKQQELLMKHTWIFTHGLAMLAYAGNLDRESDEGIVQFLQNAGAAFYLWVTTMNNHTDKDSDDD